MYRWRGMHTIMKNETWHRNKIHSQASNFCQTVRFSYWPFLMKLVKSPTVSTNPIGAPKYNMILFSSDCYTFTLYWMKQLKRPHEKLQPPLTAQMAKSAKKGVLFVFMLSKQWKKKKLLSRFNGNDVVTQNVYLHLLSLLLPCPTMCTQSGGRRSWSRNRSRTCGRTSSFCGRQQTKSTICV